MVIKCSGRRTYSRLFYYNYTVRHRVRRVNARGVFCFRRLRSIPTLTGVKLVAKDYLLTTRFLQVPTRLAISRSELGIELIGVFPYFVRRVHL